MFGELNKNNYLKYDKQLYDSSIKSSLTKSIFDIHIHVDNGILLDESKITEDRFKKRFELSVPLSGFSFEKNKQVCELLYKNIKQEGLFFAHPLKEVNLKQANKYIGQKINNSSVFGLITASVNYTIDYFEELIEKYGFIGFKPYPDLCFIEDESKINISDYVSEDMLKVANKYKLIILIHLKSRNGLQGIDCDYYLKEIYNMLEKYPDIKIIIPHMGRLQCPKIALSGLKKFINIFGNDIIYFDTSACTQKDSFKAFFENYSIDKILFGNDFPYTLIRAKFYCIEDRQRILVPRENYPWYKEKGFDRNISLFAYESLISLIAALDELKMILENHKKIFFKNAHNLINKVAKTKIF